MKDASTLISGIYYKVKLLVDHNKRLTLEIESLKHQNLKLKNELISQDELLQKLQMEFDELKINKTIGSDENKEKNLVVIDELVRRIDKSLNLLNK